MADARRPSPIPRGHTAAFLAFLQTCVVGVRRVLSTREALGGTSDKVLDLTDHPTPHPSAPLSSKASSQALQGRQRGGAPDGEHTPVAAGTSRPPPGVKRAKAKHTLVLRPRSDRFRVPAASPTPARPPLRLLSAPRLLQVCQPKSYFLSSALMPSLLQIRTSVSRTSRRHVRNWSRDSGAWAQTPQTLPGKENDPGYGNHGKSCQKLVSSAMRIMTHESPSIFFPPTG